MTKDIDDVYRDRNLLACALARVTDELSGWKVDPESPDSWAIIWIETPEGQVSWHVPRKMAEIMGPEQRDSDFEWYDTETKNERLESWVTNHDF